VVRQNVQTFCWPGSPKKQRLLRSVARVTWLPLVETHELQTVQCIWYIFCQQRLLLYDSCSGHVWSSCRGTDVTSHAKGFPLRHGRVQPQGGFPLLLLLLAVPALATLMGRTPPNPPFPYIHTPRQPHPLLPTLNPTDDVTDQNNKTVAPSGECPWNNKHTLLKSMFLHLPLFLPLTPLNQTPMTTSPPTNIPSAFAPNWMTDGQNLVALYTSIELNVTSEFNTWCH